jgi:hypothetical protein
MGIKTAIITVAILAPAKMDKLAKTKPKNQAPLVPANIFAGLKLKTKNPSTAPPAIAESIATAGWLTSGLKLKKNTAASDAKVTPPARPSVPSSQLIALRKIRKYKT